MSQSVNTDLMQIHHHEHAIAEFTILKIGFRTDLNSREVFRRLTTFLYSLGGIQYII